MRRAGRTHSLSGLWQWTVDLVLAPGFVSQIENYWEQPDLARWLLRLGSFARVITFDKRGTGLSDRVAELPTLEQRMDDVRAVLDAIGSARAALFGHSEGGCMCIMFAATYPERTVALITYGAYAKRLRSDDYPWAPTREERLRGAEELERNWVARRSLTSPTKRRVSQTMSVFRNGWIPTSAAAHRRRQRRTC